LSASGNKGKSIVAAAKTATKTATKKATTTTKKVAKAGKTAAISAFPTGKPIARTKTTTPQPAPKKPTNLLPWIAVATAGALVVTGGVFVGMSVSNQGQIDNPTTPAKQAWDALYQRNWQTPTGWTFVGLGVAAGAGAAVLFLLPKKKTKTAALPPSRKAPLKASSLLQR
jgi:hypothetical protein